MQNLIINRNTVEFKWVELAWEVLAAGKTMILLPLFHAVCDDRLQLLPKTDNHVNSTLPNENMFKDIIVLDYIIKIDYSNYSAFMGFLFIKKTHSIIHYCEALLCHLPTTTISLHVPPSNDHYQ